MIDQLLSSAEELTQMASSAIGQGVDVAQVLPALNDTSRRLISISEGVDRSLARLNSSIDAWLNMTSNEISLWSNVWEFSSSELDTLYYFVRLAAKMRGVGTCLSTQPAASNLTSPADACGVYDLMGEFNGKLFEFDSGSSEIRALPTKLNSAVPYPQADVLSTSQFSVRRAESERTH